MTAPRTDEARIREAAYFMWLDEGCPEGCADTHWHAAKDAVTNAPTTRRRTAAKKPAAKSAVRKPAARSR